MNKYVMVIDDEPDNVNTLKTILKKNDYEFVHASNCDECIKKIESGKRPDLILVEVMIPGTPVHRFVKKIKDIPVAYLTVVRVSDGEKGDILKEKNVVDFIEKPFDINDLLSRVKRIVCKCG